MLRSKVQHNLLDILEVYYANKRENHRNNEFKRIQAIA